MRWRKKEKATDLNQNQFVNSDFSCEKLCTVFSIAFKVQRGQVATVLSHFVKVWMSQLTATVTDNIFTLQIGEGNYLVTCLSPP